MSVTSTIKTISTTIINLLKTRANGDLSNLTDLGEEKLRLSSSVSGFYVGDIGIAIGGIDESKGARKYLNGQKFSLNDYPDFKNWLEERKKACPSAFVNTEAEWNAIQAKSDHAQCGKFFYDKEANTVKLPRIVIVQGTSDMSSVGAIKNAGIPNIIGRTHIQQNTSNITGAFTADTSVRSSKCDNSNGDPDYTATFNANNGAIAWNAEASGIYGGSTTVQPESIQYPYFIQVKVSTEAVTHNVNELDLDLNNPFSLFDVRWSSHRIDNLSWLVSNGQYNEGNSYPTAYEYLVNKYNTGVDEIDTITYVSKTDVKMKETVSISYRLASNGMKITKDLTTYRKLVENTGTAWYFVLDPTSPGFYLPLTDGSLQGGTNETLGQFTPQGLPNITGTVGQGHATTGINGGWHNNGNTGKSNGGALYLTGTTYGSSCTWSNYSDAGLMAIDASRSNATYGNNDTKVQPNGVRGLLYFYVGEYIQGANLINLETMKAQLTNELTLTMQNLNKHRIIESYKNGESWYRVYADGWCEQGGKVTIQTNHITPVALLKSFVDTSYSLLTTSEGKNNGSSGNCGYGTIINSDKLVDSFKLQTCNGHFSAYYWRAEGFIK